jgi:tRNA(adenine34) deaminase
MDERPDFTGEQRDERFMRQAIECARQGEAAGEVPVGALLTVGEEILARAHNAPISMNDPTAHAEILVLRDAARLTANYRLNDSVLYVTLEPCVMCAGALVAARVRRLVFGCRDLRFGGVRSKFRIADSELLNHRVEIVEGVLGAEVAEMLREYFAGKR